MNALAGVAIVSVPAYQESIALDLVAELEDGGEPTAERGETMPKEQMNAEQIEEKEALAEDQEVEDEKKPETDEDESKEAMAEDTEEAKPEEDEENATAEDATAEVVMHEIETTQTYRKGDPKWGEPDTVCTHVEETVVETVDEDTEPVAAAEEDEKDRTIAELKTRIAELEAIESKYNEIMQAEAQKELEAKQQKAQTFAEKQGLDINAEEVKQAIAELDYEKIANLSMEQAEVIIAEEKQEEEPEEVPAYFQMASYVDMNMKDNGEYGDMLKPVSM